MEMEDYNQIKEQSVNWTLNESLLQSYRSIFIASQSLIISGAALTSGTWIHPIIISIAIVQLIIGYLVIVTRARIVDFYKFNLSEKGFKEEQYINNRTIRLNANKYIPGETNWRKTRIRIDLIIPLSFLLIWFCFLLQFILEKTGSNAKDLMLYFHMPCCVKLNLNVFIETIS